MPATPAPSTIRVFVQWADQTVFAGEDVECKITFKNVAPVPGIARSALQPTKVNGFAPGGERQRKTAPLHGAANHRHAPSISRSPSVPGHGHRPTLSLNVPVSTGGGRTSPGLSSGVLGGAATPGHKHRRSVSIISLGSDAGTEDVQPQSPNPSIRRPARNHGRSASLQVIPRRSPGIMNGGFFPPSSTNRAATHPSTFFSSTNPSPISEHPDSDFTPRPARRSSGLPGGASTARPPSKHRKSSGSLSQIFQFPATSSSNSFAAKSLPYRTQPAIDEAFIPRSPTISKPPDDPVPDPDLLTPVAKIITGSSVNGTPRSSGEFYSVSNNSTETLASDYVGQASNRLLSRPAHGRRQSQLAQTNHQRPPETLMMGYAQVAGSFTLDGSLVNQAPFEEVKRKGVVGGQGGGGVVGVESKNDGGLLGALGWGNIGESIGGLLGGGELSSIKEMRGIASSKSIPLLSTRQSILFVDLCLAPGESKSYNYSFTLPKGLPPTHRGKAIKVSYNLVIGTQRAATASEQQQIRHVDFPFRVLGAVNGRGELLGHDLMSPYVLLRDQARTFNLDEGVPVSSSKPTQHVQKPPDSSMQGFLSYVDTLLEKPEKENLALLSPTYEPSTRKPSIVEETPLSAKEAIDLAILRSNITTASNRSANRFEIARNGRRVAVLLLARPAYRLGETITAVLDFAQAAIPTYAIHVALESVETIDPALALRSAASVSRVTRRQHAQHSESTLFARRVVFAPTVPVSATPDFLTSGVSLEWKLRVEFVTPRLSTRPPDDDGISNTEDGSLEDLSSGGQETAQVIPGLLEQVARDDRATVRVAVQNLPCESFEISVPLRVYGAVPGDSTQQQPQDLSGLGGEGHAV